MTASLTHPIPAQAGRAEVERIPDGLHQGVEDNHYHHAPQWSGRLSGTVLWHGSESSGGSMKEMRAVMRGAIDTDSDDKKFGRDYHCRMLEPERFKREYLPEPQWHLDDANKTDQGKKSTAQTTKYVLEARKAFHAEHPKVQHFLSRDDWDAIEEMGRAVYAHPVARFFHAAGGCEVSIASTLDGLPVKVRLDKLIREGMPPTIIDLKKIRRADERTIERAHADYGYPMKAAFQVDVVKAHEGIDCDYFWVFAEDSPPYDVVVHQCDADSLAIGRVEYRAVMAEYEICVEKNWWPGRQRGNAIPRQGYPEWKLKQARRAGVLQ